MTDLIALLIATTVLYSTHHWIGATVMLVFLIKYASDEAEDPTGIKRAARALNS